jgi:transaldolase
MTPLRTVDGTRALSAEHGTRGLTRLRGLFADQGQSPWLDNLSRPSVRDGTLARLVARGIRGVTTNPTSFSRAIESTGAYDDQLRGLVTAGRSVVDAYWELTITDVVEALTLLRPVFDTSDGHDGFVSIEVTPQYAHDTARSIGAARLLHDRIGEPNLMVKLPATRQGVPAIRTLIGEGRSVNVTLILSLARYREVLEAYLSGLEDLADRGGDLATVHSVATFLLSRVDTEVDRRLAQIDTAEALALRSQAAIAHARLAYRLFLGAHSGERWERLAERGARVQRPVWAYTSTKDSAYADTRHVDDLIGPDTVVTLTEDAMNAFEDHGTLARTIDRDLPGAEHVVQVLRAVAAIDLDGVALTLEDRGIAGFLDSYDHVIGSVGSRANTILDR